MTCNKSNFATLKFEASVSRGNADHLTLSSSIHASTLHEGQDRILGSRTERFISALTALSVCLVGGRPGWLNLRWSELALVLAAAFAAVVGRRSRKMSPEVLAWTTLVVALAVSTWLAGESVSPLLYLGGWTLASHLIRGSAQRVLVLKYIYRLALVQGSVGLLRGGVLSRNWGWIVDDPQRMATLMFLASIYLFEVGERRRYRWALVALLLASTWSRTAVFASVVTWLAARYKLPTWKLAMAILGLGVTSILSYDFVTEKLGLNPASSVYRIASVDAGVRAVFERPLWGWGWAGVPTEGLLGSTWISYNSFVFVASVGGLVAVAPFIAAIGGRLMRATGVSRLIVLYFFVFGMVDVSLLPGSLLLEMLILFGLQGWDGPTACERRFRRRAM